jgi:ribosome-associated protein
LKKKQKINTGVPWPSGGGGLKRSHTEQNFEIRTVTWYSLFMDKKKINRSVQENTKMTFVRSGGPGGQKVNKTNTKVRAVLYVKDIDGLSDDERSQLRQKLSNLINSEGQLCISVQDERYQESNRKTALQRIENSIVTAARIAKKRKKTKPTKAAKEKRLKVKKLRSEIKRNRKKL